MSVKLLDNNTIFEGYSSAVVVGNGPSALDLKNGRLIDNQGFVLRLNSAPVSGYEDYVGSRTSARLVNPLTQRGGTIEFSNMPKDWIYKRGGGHTYIFSPNKNHEEEAKRKLNKFNVIVRFTEEGKKKIKKELVNKFKNHPTVGSIAVYILTHYFPESKIYTVGMDSYSRDTAHYYDDLPADDVSFTHQPDLDAKYINNNSNPIREKNE